MNSTVAPFFVVAIIIGILSGMVSQYIADSRGHTSRMFFWVGFFLPIIGLFFAFLSPVPIEDAPARTPARVASEPTEGTVTLATQLNVLSSLQQSGELTDDEFVTANQKILGTSS